MALSFQHIALLVTLLWALALLFPPTVVHAQEKVTRVIVLSSKESPELQSLLDGLKNSAHLLVTSQFNLSADICTESATIIAFGEETATSIEIMCPGKDIVILAQSYRINFANLKPAPGSWGYYLDQPLISQIRHASLNMPSIRSLGIIYTNNDLNKAEIEALSHENMRIKIQLVKIEKGQVVAQIMRDLYQTVDAVLITGNPEVWSLVDFKTYLVLGMRQGKIMIGGYSYLYMNRGSISAVHSDFFAMGEDIAQKIQQGIPRYGMTFFKKRQIVTNDLLAARYGIYIGKNSDW